MILHAVRDMLYVRVNAAVFDVGSPLTYAIANAVHQPAYMNSEDPDLLAHVNAVSGGSRNAYHLTLSFILLFRSLIALCDVYRVVQKSKPVPNYNI